MSRRKHEFENPAEAFIANALPGMSPKFRDQLIFDAGVASGNETKAAARRWKFASASFCASTIVLAAMLVGQIPMGSSPNNVGTIAESSLDDKKADSFGPLLAVGRMPPVDIGIRQGVLRVGDYGMAQNKEVTFIPAVPNDRPALDNSDKTDLQMLTPGTLSGFDGTL